MWQWKRRAVAGAAALAVAAVAVVTWSDDPLKDPNAPRDPSPYLGADVPTSWTPGELFSVSLWATGLAQPPVGLTIYGHLPGGGSVIMESDNMTVQDYEPSFPTIGWQHLPVSVYMETFSIPKDINESTYSVCNP
jgi:hypothetical protein